MEINEKVAYLKGLLEMSNISADSAEGKIFRAICDALTDIADELDCLNADITELDDAVGAIDEDLEDLENFVFDEDSDDGCDCCSEDMFEVVCPSCGESVNVDEGILEMGQINCPECGELLEFDFDECDEDCDCCGGNCGEDKE